MWLSKIKILPMAVPKMYSSRLQRFSEAVKPEAQPHTTAYNVNPSENIKAGDITVEKVNEPKFLKTNPFLVTTNVVVSKTPGTAVQSDFLHFDTIPGPVSLRLISKFWGWIPIMGTEVTVSVIQYLLSGGKFFGGVLSWGGNIKFFKKFFDVYGPVVRLHGPFGSDVVLLSRPEHASVIFQNEGPYPVRCCLDSVEKYRLESRRFQQAGPFLMYGPDWEKLRKTVEPSLKSSMLQQYDKIDLHCDEFVKRIQMIRNKQEEMPSNFKNEIYKWSLECLCSITLNRNLGFLDQCGLSPASDPARLLDGLLGATTAIGKCEYGFQIWKFVETPAWKSLVKNCDMIDGVLSKHVERAVHSLKERKDKDGALTNISVLEILLLKEGMVEEDILTVLLDMFLIGVNATTHSAAFLIYNLAKNPRSQILLFEEIVKQGERKLDKVDLENMPYLQACIKESLRIHPPIPILSRRLNTDIVVHHYSIPKGTHVLFATHLNSFREEYFEDAQKFKPERWLSNELGGFGNEFQAYAYLPFGHGPKACLAKEMVKTTIAMLIVKLLKKFKLEYNYGEIYSSNELLASPTKPLKFRFVDRVHN